MKEALSLTKFGLCKHPNFFPNSHNGQKAVFLSDPPFWDWHTLPISADSQSGLFCVILTFGHTSSVQKWKPVLLGEILQSRVRVGESFCELRTSCLLLSFRSFVDWLRRRVGMKGRWKEEMPTLVIKQLRQRIDRVKERKRWVWVDVLVSGHMY